MTRLESLAELTYYRGRVGLAAILKALDIGPGDRVATQAFTCLAVPEGIMATGAVPVWIDTEPGGVNMDAEDLARRLPGVKAVVVQHTFGIPARVPAIAAVMGGLPLIEDCCHTFASRLEGRTVGDFGVASFYSFEWGKPLVAGIGGAVTTDDADLRAKLTQHHKTLKEASLKSLLKIQLQYFAFEALYRPSSYWKVRRAFQKLARAGAAEGNYNPTGEVAEDFSLRMAGSLRRRLLGKIREAGEVLVHSNHVAGRYRAEIQSGAVGQVCLPEQSEIAFARYPLLAKDKEALLAKAEEAKVEVADWYKTPIHPAGPESWPAVHYEAGSCPRAEELSRQIVSLPVNKKTTDRDIDAVVRLLNSL
ncbi:MAG: DegT/DnrJ/EryC1/StrS family aminotransferase [Fimbriimonadaceae bacterium]|nr:DegT/DnrJ/EryC1/StrS family aminotransferase [Fimbriimonadaceae bacterium]QYK56093.1 MAG: DegT/DnrJ/EryC1/StrS family aminotransferase [Fimbriimonadaceae bacterium]